MEEVIFRKKKNPEAIRRETTQAIEPFDLARTAETWWSATLTSMPERIPFLTASPCDPVPPSLASSSINRLPCHLRVRSAKRGKQEQLGTRSAAASEAEGHGDAAAFPGVRPLRHLPLHLQHLPPPCTNPILYICL
jgi:hypothetical protein